MLNFFNRRIKLFTIWDIKLAQLAAMSIIVVIIKFFPGLTSLDYIWYFIFAFVFAIRPFYVMFIKKAN